MTTMKRSLLHTDLSRREFARAALVAAGAFAALACGGADDDAAADPQKSPPGAMPPGLPSLGGAPDTDEGRAIAAFVDAIVPGKHRDPQGVVGAIDVNAPALFFDEELPAAQFTGALVLLLDFTSKKMFPGQRFADGTPEQRDEVIAKALEQDSPLDFAVQLAKLAFYSTHEGGKTVGYPGANGGYVNDRDFSFGKAMSREITPDGNLP